MISRFKGWLIRMLGGTPLTAPGTLVSAAATQPRPPIGRFRRFVGSAFLAGFAYVTPQTQRAVALSEALGGSILGDRGSATSDEDIGFRPITGNKARKIRDLTILSSKEMIDVALFLYHSNALAEFLVDMPISLVVGDELGYSVAVNAERADMSPEEAKKLTEQIRKILDKFWYHPAHDISTKAPEYARTYMVTGHLVLPVVALNTVDGVPQFDLIDAGQITGVLPRGNSAIVPGVVKFAPTSIADKEQAMLILQRDVDGSLLARAPEEAATPFEQGLLPGLDPAIKIIGEGLYFRRNKLLNSMRGISYLMPVADWLDALDQFTWATLDRAKLRNAIVWHLKLQGMTDQNKIDAEVTRVIGIIGKAGSVYGSNEAATLEAKQAELGAADSVELGRMILTHILGSKGIPESWYSNGGDSNRSTAAEQTDVAYKALQVLQTVFKGIFQALLYVAYDTAQAKQSAVFPKRTESPWLSIEPDMPVVQERDMSRMAAALGQLVSALSQGRDDEFISERSSRRTVLDAISQVTGASFDLDAEEAQIETETKAREKRDAQAQADAARLALQKGLGRRPPGGGGAPPNPPAAPPAAA